jgi:alpha-1,2-mannosyltransferase
LHALTQGNVNGWETINLPPWVTLVRYALVLALLGAVVWAMRRRPEKRNEPQVAEDLDLGLLIGVMLLVSPITWYHYYVWIYLPLIIIFDYLVTHTTSPRRLILFAVAYGLLVTQGFSQIRAFDQPVIQNVWLLRVLLSSSLFGAALFIGLTLRLRSQLR